MADGSVTAREPRSSDPSAAKLSRRAASRALGRRPYWHRRAFCLLTLCAAPQALATEQPEPLEGVRKLIKDGKYAQAETAARSLRQDVEARAGADSLEAARVLDVLVEALWRGGKAGGSEPRQLIDKAIALKESALGREDPEVARSLNQLGNVLVAAGDYASARPHLERALAIRQKALGPVHIDIAVSLHNLGTVEWRMGALSAAQSLYEQALALDEKIVGPDSPEVGHVLNNLGTLLVYMGDHAGAKARLERSVRIRERTLGPDHPYLASSLNDLGIVLKELGDYAGARALFERAVAIDEKALDPDHPILGIHLSGLGAALLDLGEYGLAKPRFERARAILDREGVSDRLFWAAEATAGLGELLRATGDLSGARREFERALEITAKTVGPDHIEAAELRCILAETLLETGEAQRAEGEAARAIAILEKTAGSTSPLLARGLVARAQAAAAAGDFEGALATALRAEAVSREHLQLTARVLAERQMLSYAFTRASGLDLALSLLASRPTLTRGAADVLHAVIRSRALVLDEMAARHRTAYEVGDPEVAQRARALTGARERLARLVVRGPQQDPSDHYLRLVEDARLAKERAEQELAVRSVVFRQELARSQLGLKEVTAALPERSALVAFVRYEHKVPVPGGRGKAPGSLPSYLVLVLRAGEPEPALVALGSAGPIDAAIARWRAQIVAGAIGASRASAHTEAAYRAVSAELREKVWDPVSRQLGSAARVFVVPDGALHMLNLGSLAVDRDAYLVETGALIQYLTTERDIVPLERARTARGLLALGAPAFDAAATAAGSGVTASASAAAGARKAFRGTRSACADFQSLNFEPLPASLPETDEIAAVWQRAFGVADGSSAVQLRGAAASEAAFKREAPGRRVVHLATHGFFLGDRCASALGLPLREGNRSRPAGENPLLLAGLALAGANRRSAAGPEEEDGILTAEEIATLDLQGMEWAVLSACDTGAGELRKGEGVFGLRRAFQLAGVRTVIMSLWPVEDEAAGRWMKALYRGRFQAGLATAEAVREATVSVLKERRAGRRSTHPFHWGGFIAVGDWR